MQELLLKGDFSPLYFSFENYGHVSEGDFGLKKLILVKKLISIHFRRENEVDQNQRFETTLTRDLNSFTHFLGPKNKMLRILYK